MLITGRANTDVSRYHSIADIMAETKCKCRAVLQEGWNFCAQCGTRIKQDVKASFDWYRLEPELKQFKDQHREQMGHRRIWPLPERKKPKVTDIIRCYVGGKEVGYFERREVKPQRQGDAPPWWLLLLGPPGWLLLLEWLFSAP